MTIEESPDGYRKISIWFRPETVGILQHIQKVNHLGVLEDAIDYLIQGWQINQHQQFSWEFNQCRRPKFWFGQIVRHKPTGMTGRIVGIEWCSAERIKQGFWYAVERSSFSRQWMQEMDLAEGDRTSEIKQGF